MTREEAIAALKPLEDLSDHETAHQLADDVLCDLLRSLDCVDVVQAWKAVEKWYA